MLIIVNSQPTLSLCNLRSCPWLLRSRLRCHITSNSVLPCGSDRLTCQGLFFFLIRLFNKNSCSTLVTREHIVTPEWTLVLVTLPWLSPNRLLQLVGPARVPTCVWLTCCPVGRDGYPPHTHTHTVGGGCPGIGGPAFGPPTHLGVAMRLHPQLATLLGAAPPLSPSLSPQGRLLSDPIRRERDRRDEDQVHDRRRAAQGNPEGGLLVCLPEQGR